MEFQCIKCNKIFYPHRFIAVRHPSRATCPLCDSRGMMTDRGRKRFKDMHGCINRSRYKDK